MCITAYLVWNKLQNHDPVTPLVLFCRVFFLAQALLAHWSHNVIQLASRAMAARSRSPPSSRTSSRPSGLTLTHQTQIMRLRGKSNTSQVNVSLQHGRLSLQGLAGLRTACAVELSTMLLPSMNTPGDAEIFFRLSDKVRAQKTNGGHFEQLASPAARQWLDHFRSRNLGLYNRCAKLRDETYSTNPPPPGQRTRRMQRSPSARSSFATAPRMNQATQACMSMAGLRCCSSRIHFLATASWNSNERTAAGTG